MPSLITILEKLASNEEPSAKETGWLVKDVLLPAFQNQRNLWEKVTGKRGNDALTAAQGQMFEKVRDIAAKTVGKARAKSGDADRNARNYLLTTLRNLAVGENRKFNGRWGIENTEFKVVDADTGEEETVSEAIGELRRDENEASVEASADPVEAEPVLGAAWVVRMSDHTRPPETVSLPPMSKTRCRSGLLRTGLEFFPWFNEPLTNPPGGNLNSNTWEANGGQAHSTTQENMVKLGFHKDHRGQGLWGVFCSEKSMKEQDECGVFLWLRITFLPWKPEIVDLCRIERMQP